MRGCSVVLWPFFNFRVDDFIDKLTTLTPGRIIQAAGRVEAHDRGT